MLLSADTLNIFHQ